MKKLAFKWLLLWLINLFSVGAILYFFEIGAVVADGVTLEGLTTLRPGMGTYQIKSLIGVPLYEKCDWSSSVSEETKVCNGKRTLIYGKPSPYLGNGLEIYLHTENEHLTGVYVEEYDLGLYKCDSDGCPSIYKMDALKRLNRRHS